MNEAFALYLHPFTAQRDPSHCSENYVLSALWMSLVKCKRSSELSSPASAVAGSGIVCALRLLVSMNEEINLYGE